MMIEEQLPEFPIEFENYLDKPYGGLFGTNAQIRIVEEIVADPYRDYRPKYLAEIIGASEPTIRSALKNLLNLGLLEKDTNDIQHPIYRLNLHSKKVIALTFLSYASIDDIDESTCMDEAVFDYYHKEIEPKMQVNAIGVYQVFEFGGRTITNVKMTRDDKIETFRSIGAQA